ncbi:SRPBCC family protein [Salisediminibacterium halotolerans]|uniref:Ligand-binding SRPBCC domain-containing protein n=1 Tax=Salisediminibacterium halotolerans TaxID=517425 RepID=A0A1H9PDK7_9BACI|nr:MULTISPECIES: hypothetical protein [Salisediminibacterium]RLJ78039.1 ligand-binding SRPBCC domain-containing protein [Actinophytocola xinjiangensis]RPE88623.1 ligand-binding SRPBCC domain-containing protein [Salisediminibacterium halotolerans]TWG37016.1 ligand-binding SRPBCC domain-containing protein [Salisediminibacterium halotolerans]SER45889.1 Ligand-binding SRPBCC domain-containing protein [Salisediminibacterium haloalkalitolerans]GEL08281.1 hypothetical protein SHA02_16970 [Salisedimin
MFKGTFYYATLIPRPLNDTWDFFQKNENLAAITGFPKVKVFGDHLVEQDAEVKLKLHFGFISLNWHGRITELSAERYFIDEGEDIPFPFKSWRHVHAFKAVDESTTKMIDRVTFESFLPAPLIKLMLSGMFFDRKRQLNKLFSAR